MSRPGPPGSSERTYAGNSGKLDRAPVSISPSPSSASWTGSRYAAQSLRPGGASRRRAGRAVEQSRGGYATSRTATTIDRGPRSSARARSRSAALVSSRSASAAPSLGGSSNDTCTFKRGSTRTATALSWRSSSTSAAARSRARRCPFPRGGRLDNREALEEVGEQREPRVRHSFGVAVRRSDPGKQGLRDPPQGRQGVEGGRVR